MHRSHCACSSLRVYDYRAFRAVQAALQTATAAVSSHELVGRGNNRNSVPQLSGYPRPRYYEYYFSLHTDLILCAPTSTAVVVVVRLVYLVGEKRRASQPKNSFV